MRELRRSLALVTQPTTLSGHDGHEADSLAGKQAFEGGPLAWQGSHPDTPVSHNYLL